jgi:hypothetical protein
LQIIPNSLKAEKGLQMELNRPENNIEITSPLMEDLHKWRCSVGESIALIKTISVTTEDEFLSIGSRLQEFYGRSNEIRMSANRLLQAVSGEHFCVITERLWAVLAKMDEYISTINTKTQGSCVVLADVLGLLDNIAQPLEGFQKMYKTLRMLGISTKIESSRIGEKGAGFLTLAQDVERLSLLVNEKSSNILSRSSMLSGMISDNIRHVNTYALAHISELVDRLKATEDNLRELLEANRNFSQFSEEMAELSAGVSEDVGNIVSSLQSHDITRQQLEHVVEALEKLEADIVSGADQGNAVRLVVESGDVCELQSAMLAFSSSELFESVTTTIESLQHLSETQKMMTGQTAAVMNSGSSSGNSFIENISAGMSSVMSVLDRCVQAEHELSKTMTEILSTIGDVSGFVTDIEGIGSEIDLIALNSQIMAAHTGLEGAALGVLAEAIKRLSLDAFNQTEVVAGTLSRINGITGHILEDLESQQNLENAETVSAMSRDFKELIASLNSMAAESSDILTSLFDDVAGLTEDIEHTAAGITAHETSKQMSDRVLAELNRIVEASRRLQPASPEFIKNLKHMESRYTMNSERRIHEAIARRHDKHASVSLMTREHNSPKSDSEFGDNVDLF